MILKQEIRKTRRAGFTLMEMLVVVAIIVALAGMGGYYFIGQLNESKVSNAKVQAKVVSNAVKTYFTDHGYFPNSLEDLLRQSEIGKGPYLESMNALMDPWGKEYRYDQSGSLNAQAGSVVLTPDVFTTTPDNRTVGNWPEAKR